MLKLKLQYFGHLMWRTDSLEKTLMLEKIEGKRRRGGQEDEMIGWHEFELVDSMSRWTHQLHVDGHEFEQAPDVCDGQGSLACGSPWGRKESDIAEWLNCSELYGSLNFRWYCLSMGSEWKLTFSSPVAIAEFSKFAGILSAALSQHRLLGFEIPLLEFHHLN